MRAKLVWSFAAVSVLMMVLVLAVGFVLAQTTARNTAFANLEQKQRIAVPFIALVLLDERGAGRPALSETARRALKSADLRVFVLNRDTLQVEHDTGGNAELLDKQFPFEAASVVEQLRSGQSVRGIATFESEADRYQYVAQLIPVAARPLGGPQGRPPRQYIVVAQPEPSLVRILQSAQELLLPAVLIGVAVALIAAYFLARSIADPVTRLSQAAAAVSRGDYNQQLPVRGQDEIAALTGQFNVMAQAVSHADQMQRDFVANISHDLKTPLTSIQGFSQAMLDGSIADAAGYKQAAQIIDTESQRMSRMVTQLLNLTQLQNGLRALELRPVELGPLLGQLVLTMQPQTTAAGIELVAQFSTDSVVVLGNADMLKQAFGNLIDNALKHTPGGGTITMSLLPVGNGVNVLVSDTGAGIPASEVQRVMERFYQVDKARASGQERSLGLGLAITREVIQAHHGNIRIDSVEGKGTSVSVWLPASIGHSPRAGDTGAEPATTSVAGNGRAESYVPDLPASTSAGSKST
ncbi:MAG: HAMP domain-containing histidine kinase [Chloroflexota bacterium]|nr:HAMP domain-containing histidine kinase [Chloroflexota bacterium]